MMAIIDKLGEDIKKLEEDSKSVTRLDETVKKQVNAIQRQTLIDELNDAVKAIEINAGTRQQTNAVEDLFIIAEPLIYTLLNSIQKYRFNIVSYLELETLHQGPKQKYTFDNPINRLTPYIKFKETISELITALKNGNLDHLTHWSASELLYEVMTHGNLIDNLNICTG
jgi:hypothetical protein